MRHVHPKSVGSSEELNASQLSLWADPETTSSPATDRAASHVIPAAAPDFPELLLTHGPTRPSRVFNTYWTFAAARQEIFFRRFAGEPPPWSSDPILQEHKFTNAYRACDRVSQFLIREVIGPRHRTPEEVFFRVLVFKLFNRIETWHRLERTLGGVSWHDYSFDRYDAVLSAAMGEGHHIYSAAYIMPSARLFGHERKHSNHLRLIELMMKEQLPRRLQQATSMEDAFSMIRKYHSIGDFLAYQYVTDLNYSDLIDFDEDSFVVAGPGARDGIKKCFDDTGGLSDADVIRTMVASQEEHFDRLGISFKTLWGRRLKNIDCQNLFCEVGKYARVAHPEALGLSGRTRIKQKFSRSPETLHYTFPEKWGLNEAIARAAPPAVIGRGQMSFGF